MLSYFYYLNQIEFVHRDFKPEYVLFFPSENFFKLADKFANFKDPVSNLKKNITEAKELHCSPKFFNEVMQKNQRKKSHQTHLKMKVFRLGFRF